MKKSIHQTNDPSIHPSIHPSANQPTNQPTNQKTKKQNNQTTKQTNITPPPTHHSSTHPLMNCFSVASIVSYLLGTADNNLNPVEIDRRRISWNGQVQVLRYLGIDEIGCRCNNVTRQCSTWKHDMEWHERRGNTVTSKWHLKSPASRLFAQLFVQAQIKENIKVPLHWPLWGESTGDRWFPLTW